ncbi:hypothetical protein LEP1GSC047_2801 [Leptospira inadai serovar Lyme str. 10]|uniref:Uncharacterized protein n=1 Tax=Leptospira inadai serovar Lyme str. 10 TaxID=1049790 RepID=V6HBG0_9LEPT|nr:hypothetical protein LEP1GSC047_2801 [Leptospira inadai serovar Lyme str. 10]
MIRTRYYNIIVFSLEWGFFSRGIVIQQRLVPWSRRFRTILSSF